MARTHHSPRFHTHYSRDLSRTIFGNCLSITSKSTQITFINFQFQLLNVKQHFKAIRAFTSKRLFLVVILIWVISGLSSLPIMTATVYGQAYHKHFGKRVDICYSSIKEEWQFVYLFLSLFFFYMLPCLLLFILYGKIVYVIKNRNIKSLTANGSENTSRAFRKTQKYNGPKESYSLNETDVILKVDPNDEKKKRLETKKSSSGSVHPMNQKQIVILLIIMMFLILLLLLPYRVFSIWTAMASKAQLIKLGINNYYSLLNFCRVTFYTNSAINPIFYHILSSKFQNAFKNVLKRKGSKNNNNKRTTNY